MRKNFGSKPWIYPFCRRIICFTHWTEELEVNASYDSLWSGRRTDGGLAWHLVYESLGHGFGLGTGTF